MEDKMISGARIILECLSRLGVKNIFGYPGGSVIPIYDVLYSLRVLIIIFQDMNRERHMKLTGMQGFL